MILPTAAPLKYRFVIELFAQKSDESLGSEGIARPDFEPALQGATFEVWRQSLDRSGAPLDEEPSQLRIEPRWQSDDQRPLIQGVEIKLGDKTIVAAPVDIFKRDAATLATRLVEDKKIEAGTKYVYRVSAYPGHPAPPSAPKPAIGLAIETAETGFPEAIGDASTGADGCIPETRDADHGAEHDMEVYLPQRVFSQASAMADSANGHEIGGFLVGHLARVDGKLAAVVSDQLPAWHTDRAEMSLGFTPKTWQALDESLKLRDRNEILIGWHHLHPAKSWCDKCARESKDGEELELRLGACPYQSPFFSEADRQMSRAAFAAPYQIGLLVVDTTLKGIQFGMYGWRDGVLDRRAYQVVDDTSTLINSAPSLTPGATAVS